MRASVIETAGNSRGIKIHNRLLVRNTIREHAPIARHEIAKLTGLTASAVTVIVNELMGLGILREVGHGKSSGGRRPVMLELNARAGYIFAVRLQRGEFAAALLDLAGGVLEKQFKRLDTSSPETVAEAVEQAFRTITRSVGVSSGDVLWCGVASPGLIDSSCGMLERSYNLQWDHVPLGMILSTRLDNIPVHVENTSNAAAFAEKEYGSGRGSANLLYISLSVGIGGGIIIGGEIYGGARGYAGEIGHTALISDGGPACTCGSSGCFEALCSVKAVLNRIKAEVPEATFKRYGLSAAKITMDNFVLPPVAEIPEVQKIIRETGRYTGIMIANLANTFNPDLVILGGELARAGEIFMKAVKKEVKERTLNQIEEAVQVVRSTMMEDPALMGAYALALGNIFAIDEWRKGRRQSS